MSAQVALDPLRVHRVLRRLAEVFLLLNGPSEREAFRASGECVCTCGYAYWRHARDPFEPYLNVLCDGERVKL